MATDLATDWVADVTDVFLVVTDLATDWVADVADVFLVVRDGSSRCNG